MLLRDGEVVGRVRRAGARVDGRPARRLPGRGARCRARPAIRRCRGLSATPSTSACAPGAGPPAAPPARGPPRAGRPATWHIEKDARSAGTVPRRRPSGGLIRHTLRYELGRGGASPFVALVTDDVGAMHDASRLAFRAAADRPHAPVGPGAPGRRRRRAALAALGLSLPGPARRSPSPSPTCASRARANARPFAPARIHSLLFVVDSVNARPGDRGVRVGRRPPHGALTRRRAPQVRTVSRR